MSPAVAEQAVVTGLALGAVYGLVGLGFTLVFRLTRTLALAHGDLLGTAVFLGVYLLLGSRPIPVGLGTNTSLALLGLVLAGGVVLSVLTYAVAVRPFVPGVGRGAQQVRAGAGPGDVLGWVAAAIAVGLLLREGDGAVFPLQAYRLPDPLQLASLSASGSVGLPGGGTVQVRYLAVLVIAAVVGVVTERYLVASRLGRALRAVSQDPDTAALMGVPTERVVVSAFAVAGLLAGLAGLLAAPGVAFSTDAGLLLGLKGIGAALLGRLGSLRGALLGGLAVGVAEQLAVNTAALGAGFDPVLALAVLVVVVALRPQGLRGAVRQPVE